jgi:hypothetical protein
MPAAESPAGKGPDLRTLLRSDPPASVAALPEEARAELARIIGAARRRQAQELAASYEASLRHVPGPVRRVVRKVLGA